MKKVQVRQRAWPQDSGQDVKDDGVCFQIRDKLNFHTDEHVFINRIDFDFIYVILS